MIEILAEIQGHVSDRHRHCLECGEVLILLFSIVIENQLQIAPDKVLRERPGHDSKWCLGYKPIKNFR
ncbi:hypothetical protein [Stieleria neptunia]|uniref:hypothetical protein n=1 Tax=Stieleria neptunia TaxID=2527979 RepID=UPI0011A8BD2A|nr:hypothetical protein [Stieleria neptunia]